MDKEWQDHWKKTLDTPPELQSLKADTIWSGIKISKNKEFQFLSLLKYAACILLGLSIGLYFLPGKEMLTEQSLVNNKESAIKVVEPTQAEPEQLITSKVISKHKTKNLIKEKKAISILKTEEVGTISSNLLEEQSIKANHLSGTLEEKQIANSTSRLKTIHLNDLIKDVPANSFSKEKTIYYSFKKSILDNDYAHQTGTTLSSIFNK